MYIDTKDKDFGIALNCAIRYCIGRQSYMPSLIIGYVRPLLPHLDYATVKIMWNDVRAAEYYGDESIDKPLWMGFLKDLAEELDRREKEGNE